MTGKSEVQQLQRLAALGFSSSEITEYVGNGWTPAQILKKTDELLATGYCSEKNVADDFRQQYAGTSARGDLMPLFQTLDKFTEQQAEWLVDGYIPRGQITTLASDGGIGKTSCWVNLAAAVSSGKPSFLDRENNKGRKPGKVLFLSSEDSVRIVLKHKLVSAGANEQNIFCPDFSADRSGVLRNLKFGSPELCSVLREIRPELCIFDPIQGFIPSGINMSDRGQMRDCMAPLITWGEQYGTTFLVVCHTNKRQKASGRDRIADSADLWDISRSVLMAGYTEVEGIRYLSQEKSNYGPLQESILFSIDRQGVICNEGYTWKRDRDYQAIEKKTVSKQEDTETWLIRYLEEKNGEVPAKELCEAAACIGISDRTLERARSAIAKQGKIRSYCTGFGTNKRTIWALTYFAPNRQEQ